MRIIAYKEPKSIDEQDSLVELEVPKPSPKAHDLLIEVKAVSVNPVDVKLRAGTKPKNEYGVLGWDASGVVKQVGDNVTLFNVGDEVYYAGAMDREGSNSEFHLVDERIVGHKPVTLTFAEAAALPLTSITAWETLFDRLCIQKKASSNNNSILIIGGAGGVGSMAIQLIRAFTDLKIIATASRAESKKWINELGADFVIDHSHDLMPQLQNIGVNEVGYVFSTNFTDKYLDQFSHLIAPQGHLALIDDPETLNIRELKDKCIAVHWEFIFTRSMLKTFDMQMQGEILNKVKILIDTGHVKTTLTDLISPINAENMKLAHKKVEQSHMIGKVVVADW